MLKNTSEVTSRHLQLGVGLLFFDIKISDLGFGESVPESVGKLLNNGESFLGATRGGADFRAQPVVRQYRSDGYLFPEKSGAIVTGWNVELSAEIVEFTPSLLGKILPDAVVDNQVQKVSRIGLAKVLNEQYTENLIWAGDLSNGTLIAIELRNVLNFGGISIKTEFRESALGVRFIPHAGDVFDVGQLPFEIYFLE